MKRIINTFRPKKKQQAMQQPAASASRITNETVAEHRERVLAGGRKFKYPLQYPKHRVVVMTVLITILLIAILSGIGIWQLYGAQNTSKFMLRVAQVVPVAVGRVDGKRVLYSNYLLELRSALHYLSTKEAVNFSSDDGKRQLNYQKRLALNKAIESAYVQKLAGEQEVAVTGQELDEFIKKEFANNELGVTADMYRQVIADYYDWTFEDYKNSVRNQLLRKKLAAKIDTAARKKINDVRKQLNEGADFAALAKERSDEKISGANGGDLGFVSNSANDPSGLIAAATQMKQGQFSEVIEGVDGFYVIKVHQKRENDIHFSQIVIAYTELDNRLTKLRDEDKIKEYISVPETVQSTNRQ
jgi:parvulin-like peptidyl-prolyl isomerase